ncbi:UNKNOWN [Stylonychia lemnae]|uniref:Kelch motif family protein n=1 Tax=Stylonychia lemnae TaxID=5949 RepID=A0A078AYA5_STYLE|nr:UNKNOWN [Stylonychia lemnae]|eukprot:CDW87380.1 UNKNOWN [Stylonychia lemnae]
MKQDLDQIRGHINLKQDLLIQEQTELIEEYQKLIKYERKEQDKIEEHFNKIQQILLKLKSQQRQKLRDLMQPFKTGCEQQIKKNHEEQESLAYYVSEIRSIDEEIRFSRDLRQTMDSIQNLVEDIKQKDIDINLRQRELFEGVSEYMKQRIRYSTKQIDDTLIQNELQNLSGEFNVIYPKEKHLNLSLNQIISIDPQKKSCQFEFADLDVNFQSFCNLNIREIRKVFIHFQINQTGGYQSLNCAESKELFSFFDLDNMTFNNLDCTLRMNTPRKDYSLCYQYIKEKNYQELNIYAVSGQNSKDFQIAQSIERLDFQDPKDIKWQIVGSLEIPRIKAQSIVIDDNIYVFGGYGKTLKNLAFVEINQIERLRINRYQQQQKMISEILNLKIDNMLVRKIKSLHQIDDIGGIILVSQDLNKPSNTFDITLFTVLDNYQLENKAHINIQYNTANKMSNPPQLIQSCNFKEKFYLASSDQLQLFNFTQDFITNKKLNDYNNLCLDDLQDFRFAFDNRNSRMKQKRLNSKCDFELQTLKGSYCFE